jgi:hypothetical protein
MASTTYRTIQHHPETGRFTREQIREAVRAVRLALSEKQARKKAQGAGKARRTAKQ